MNVPHPDNKVESTSHNADSEGEQASTGPKELPLAALPIVNNNPANEKTDARPREIGGRDDNSPDPTRFGDWEKAGRCIDF